MSPQEPHAGVGENSTEFGPTQSGLDETDRIVAVIAERFPLTDAVVRIRYKATEEQHRRADQQAIRRLVHDAGGSLYQIAPDIIRATRERSANVDETLEPIAALDAYLASTGLEAPKGDALRALIGSYLETT